MATDPARNGTASRGHLPPVLQEAVAAHRAGDLEAAQPLYRRFLRDHPEHPTALQLLGLLHSERGEYQAAIDLMHESLRLFPDQAEVANNLGNALSHTRRYEEAMECYSHAVTVSPRYAEAWRNLGLCLLEQDRFQDAGKCLQRCVEIEPENASTWLALGNAWRGMDRVEDALACYEKSLALRPDYAQAHHNAGVCLRMLQRTGEALERFGTARELGLDHAALYQNLGSTLVDAGNIGPAIDAYRDAIRRDPQDATSHRNLNKLLWEQELLEDHLASYRQVLAKHPGSAPLYRDYAIALNQHEDFELAEKTLVQGLHHSPESGDLKSLLAYTLEGQGRWEDALRMHADAVASPGSTPEHRVSYVRALLACQRPDEALGYAEQAVRETPFNQRSIAYLGLCWRMLGDGRDDVINDYQNLVRVYDIPVPRDFGNTREFNARLSEILATLHVSRRHPPEQTLRGGTQTFGDLFDRREREIGMLVSSLSECIQDYIARFPPEPSHPLFMRRAAQFRYAASWSVRLQPCGFHTMHIHPLGWISSAYYVQVPPEITDTEVNGGGIKFGEPDIELGERGRARRLIQPATGRLVLFPSYMWHGTVPFEADDPRMTVAFDVIPSAGGGAGEAPAGQGR